MKKHERSIEHHQSATNDRTPRTHKRKLMGPANFPVGTANRAPKRKLPKNSQIVIKSIGPIEVWDVHEQGLDFDEIWIDLTAETASEEWETRLVFENPTQAKEFITKLREALAQESEETTGTPTDPKDVNCTNSIER